MKVLIVQLSDIHIKNGKNHIIDKSEKIKGAILSLHYTISKCFIVITGDIAYSGINDEYNIAMDFLFELKEMLNTEGVEFEYIFIPGNHDCDFYQDNSIRKGLLANISNIKIDEEIVSTMTKIQTNFFELLEQFNEINIENRILYKYKFKLDGVCNIVFNCINTAWMSSIHEKYGSLLFPFQYIENELKKENNCDINISLLHHPYNWFTFEGRKKLSAIIEENSDIIFTGHEHDGDMFSCTNKEGEVINYIEGGVLQESENPMLSSFNVAIIDTKDVDYQYYEFTYIHQSGIYENTFTSEKRSLASKFSNSYKLKLKQDFEDFLNDAGVDLLNSEKAKVYLEDIYIPADLKAISSKSEEDSDFINEVLLNSSNLCTTGISQKHIFIVGDTLSGKTVLFKQTYKSFLRQDYVPLFLDGEKIKTYREEDLIKLLLKEYSLQYKDSVEKYKQTSKSQKILLLDNFNNIKLNILGKNKVLGFLKEYFGIVICSVTEELYMEIIALKNDSTVNIKSFDFYQLSQFGHLLRHKLIAKWYSMGCEYYTDEKELDRKIKKAESKINVLLGKNLMPASPLYIIVLLPLCENMDSADIQDKVGSYGYLYETLINNNIARVSSKMQIDTKYTYLSIIAYNKFINDLVVLNGEEIRRYHQIYEDVYDKKIEFEQMINELAKANILDIRGDSFTFKYGYLEYYFIAKYISNNLDEVDVRNLVKELSDKVYIEKNANIILFLCHLSKDRFIIENILNNAKEIYKEYEPCDLDDNVSFLNDLYEKIEEFYLDDDDPRKNNEENLLEQDRIEYESKNLSHKEVAAGINEDEDITQGIEESIMLTKALKTMQILGLIVKNFEGSLKSDLKYDVTKECYSLGMRTVAGFIRRCEDNLGDLIESLPQLFDQNIENEEEAKRFLYAICELLAFSIIKKISSTIGVEELDVTYSKILSTDSYVSFKLIDANIRMDNYSDFPESVVLKLNKELEKNLFSRSILVRSVIHHFYLYTSDRAIRQRVCEHLKIKQNTVKMLSTANKV